MKKKNLSRREFIGITAAGAAALALPRLARSQAPSQPNIVWIMSDEHNWTVSNAYNADAITWRPNDTYNRAQLTPNIDLICSQGITFDGHYCNSPMCAPSRLSLTACQYASRVRMWNNQCELQQADIDSIATVLTAAGYDTILCGKQHYAFDRRYGFLDKGQPGISNADAAYFNGTTKSGNGNRLPSVPAFSGTSTNITTNAHAGGPNNPDATVQDHDIKVTTDAVAWATARGQSQDATPFFFFAGYLAPHFKYVAPQTNVDFFTGQIQAPQGTDPDFVATLVPNYQALRYGLQETGATDGQTSNARECYFGLTQWVDEQIGTLRAAFDEYFGDNVIYIYTSDHGENMGDHNMWFKECMFENSARVPLGISSVGLHPEWAGQRFSLGASSHVDLVKTVFDLAGVSAADVPAQMDGDSMLPWMVDPAYAPAWKDVAVAEYYGKDIISGSTMICQGEWKYVYHAASADGTNPSQEELYNLAEDPFELLNLALNPTPDAIAQCATMKSALEAILQDAAHPEQYSLDDTEILASKELAGGYIGKASGMQNEYKFHIVTVP